MTNPSKNNEQVIPFNKKIILSYLDKKSREYPQESSTPRLETLKNDGYTEVTWKTSPGSKDFTCPRLDGKKWTLTEFINDTKFSAPIWSKSHPGCKCTLILEGPQKDPIEIFAV